MIVLAWRHEELRECLASVVAAGGHDVPYEVVIVLNGASQRVVRIVEQEISGATVVRSRVNLGFASGCNLGRNHSRGEMLLLLNDDVEVDPGWLEGLVRTLDDHPEAGAVGSRILSADGSVLLEAGSLVDHEGSPHGIGRDVPESEQRYMALRRVPFCSGCSLLVRSWIWDALGGLDERFFPAYFEDVDLCLGIKELGYDVLYQPISRARHRESASLDETFRNFVFQKSKQAFIDKWQPLLSQYGPWDRSRDDRIVRTQRGPLHVLVIDDQLPNLTSGSGFGRMYETATELLRGKWSPTIFATDVLGTDPRALGAMGIEVLRGDLALHLQDPDVSYDAVVISRPNNFARWVDLVRSSQPGAVVVYDTEALYHRRLARQMSLEGPLESIRQLQLEFDLYLGIEKDIATAADAIVTISEAEGDFFRAVPDHSPVWVRSPISWATSPGISTFRERRDMIMVAGWLAGAQSPNADGLRWFMHSVFPIVRARLPWVRLYVTGTNPPPVSTKIRRRERDLPRERRRPRIAPQSSARGHLTHPLRRRSEAQECRGPVSRCPIGLHIRRRRGTSSRCPRGDSGARRPEEVCRRGRRTPPRRSELATRERPVARTQKYCARASALERDPKSRSSHQVRPRPGECGRAILTEKPHKILSRLQVADLLRPRSLAHHRRYPDAPWVTARRECEVASRDAITHHDPHLCTGWQSLRYLRHRGSFR